VAHHKQAKKRIRQTETRRLRNNAWRSQMRTGIKRLRAAIEAGDFETAKTLLPATVSIVNRVSTKGVIHANTASRYVSRLSKAVAAMGK